MRFVSLFLCLQIILISLARSEEPSENQKSELAAESSTTASPEMTAEEKKKHVYLFDYPSKKMIKAEKNEKGEDKLLPGRLYLRWNPVLNKWTLDITNMKGKFPTTPRALLPDSVIPGDFFGEHKSKKFLFHGNRKPFDSFIEAPTAAIEFYMWEDGDPPKKATYLIGTIVYP